MRQVARRWRAVVFDLWGTLIELPTELFAERDEAIAAALAVDAAKLTGTWLRLEPAWETQPLLPSLELLCRDLGVADGDLENVLALRLAYMRRALVPEADVLDALIALRQRGLRLGLITACSGDVPIVWDETPLARSFDATVFSCDVGMCKPDPRIYRLAEDRLACPARDCLYVGDGGHDELAGAQHVGMTAVLLRRRGSSRPDPGGWTYTITSIPAVVSLLGDPR